MSYTFFEDFSKRNDRGMPYSLFSEETARYDTPDAKIDEAGYRILRKDTKQILCTPPLKSFVFTLSIRLEKTVLSGGRTIFEWSVFVGYSRNTRLGKELCFTYDGDEKRLTVALFGVSAVKREALQTQMIENIELARGSEHAFQLNVSESGIALSANGEALTFSLPIEGGMVALSTQRGADGIIFRELSLSSEFDIAATASAKSLQLIIPCLDGGEIEHTLKLEAHSYENGICEIDATLDGGAYYTKIDVRKVEAWDVPYELFCDPYIRLIKEGQVSDRLYLKNGKLCFVAKEFENASIENILGSAQMPYSVRLSGEGLSDFDAVAFGYSSKFSFGHEFFGGGREFVFDLDGNLIYDGDGLGAEYISRAESGENKKIIDLIPECLVNRERAVSHARHNHAFLTGENARFTFFLHTKKRTDRIRARATLTNAFFRELCEIDTDTRPSPHVTDRWGYSTLKTELALPMLGQGVYHICIAWYYGDTECHTHESAFEVIDTASEISPQQSAGLPLMYVGDGAPRANTIAMPDMWNPKRDFSIEHYFSCAEYRPSAAEERKPWELLRIYNRSTFIWMTQRTIGNLGWERFPLSAQNADYLNYYLPAVFDSKHSYRADLWHASVYGSPLMRELFEKFRQENPQFKDILDQIPSDAPITFEHLISMMPHCFDAWTDYFNAENDRIMTEQWNALKKINPKVKNSGYGPFPIYGSALAGGYNAKWFGFKLDSLSKAFDGFFQFEDYPFVCGYQSHYSAWGMMTVKQLAPDSRIAPELYDCFDSVCPDGFVASAYPPLGESRAEPYMTATQVYEYLYNTPVLRENGRFSYWQDACLMFYSLYVKEPGAKMKHFLRAWGDYLENRPLAPKRSIAYLTEFETADNRRECHVHRDSLYNICQSGEAYVHECSAEAGLSAGFAIDYASIEKLCPEMIDVLVIPSLRLADSKVKDKIRALYASGVSLIAVGEISGLEDLFGVKKDYKKQRVTHITLGCRSEKHT